MGRTVIIFIMILGGLYVIFTTTDTRDNYTAEKIFWDASQQLAKATRSQETTPDHVYNELIAKFDKMIVDFPHSPLQADFRLQLGKTYVAKKEYAQAQIGRA